jgi:ribosomal protein uL22
VHFKHAREVCNAIKGMKLERAKAYLQNVIDYKETVTFTKFTGGCGRHAQAKNHSASGSKGRWPQKASKMILDLVRNAEANAEMKGISVDDLIVSHSQANRAMQQRRRTYRAHGRINRKLPPSPFPPRSSFLPEFQAHSTASSPLSLSPLLLFLCKAPFFFLVFLTPTPPSLFFFHSLHV